MVDKQKSSTVSRGDLAKWIIVILLVATGVWANFHFRAYAWSLRLAVWIVLACVVGGIAYTTAKGRQIVGFGKDARLELRKVVWPTRQETIQMTMVVIGLVVTMALILWAIDSLLTAGVSWLTARS